MSAFPNMTFTVYPQIMAVNKNIHIVFNTKLLIFLSWSLFSIPLIHFEMRHLIFKTNFSFKRQRVIWGEDGTRIRLMTNFSLELLIQNPLESQNDCTVCVTKHIKHFLIIMKQNYIIKIANGSTNWYFDRFEIRRRCEGVTWCSVKVPLRKTPDPIN